MSTETLERTIIKVEPPKMWHVMLKNDDYTPFIFVIELLIELFKHPVARAEEIAQEVHDRGQASAGLFTREIAETRADQAVQRAQREGYPLKAVIEPEA